MTHALKSLCQCVWKARACGGRAEQACVQATVGSTPPNAAASNVSANMLADLQEAGDVAIYSRRAPRPKVIGRQRLLARAAVEYRQGHAYALRAVCKAEAHQRARGLACLARLDRLRHARPARRSPGLPVRAALRPASMRAGGGTGAAQVFTTGWGRAHKRRPDASSCASGASGGRSQPSSRCSHCRQLLCKKASTAPRYSRAASSTGCAGASAPSHASGTDCAGGCPGAAGEASAKSACPSDGGANPNVGISAGRLLSGLPQSCAGCVWPAQHVSHQRCCEVQGRRGPGTLEASATQLRHALQEQAATALPARGLRTGVRPVLTRSAGVLQAFLKEGRARRERAKHL